MPACMQAFSLLPATGNHSGQHHRDADPVCPAGLANSSGEMGQSGCYVLIRYMALLFVPIGVGVMQYFDLLRAQFGPVVVSCAVSTLVVFLVVSWSSQLVHGERKVVGQKGSEE